MPAFFPIPYDSGVKNGMTVEALLSSGTDRGLVRQPGLVEQQDANNRHNVPQPHLFLRVFIRICSYHCGPSFIPPTETVLIQIDLFDGNPLAMKLDACQADRQAKPAWAGAARIQIHYFLNRM